MRRLFSWTAGVVGIAALARLLASRRARVESPALPPAPSTEDPAAELRRKLDESRATTASPPPGPTAGPEPSGAEESLDERRARVHAKAQEALSAMDAPQEPPA